MTMAELLNATKTKIEFNMIIIDPAVWPTDIPQPILTAGLVAGLWRPIALGAKGARAVLNEKWIDIED